MGYIVPIPVCAKLYRNSAAARRTHQLLWSLLPDSEYQVTRSRVLRFSLSHLETFVMGFLALRSYTKLQI